MKNNDKEETFKSDDSSLLDQAINTLLELQATLERASDPKYALTPARIARMKLKILNVTQEVDPRLNIDIDQIGPS